MDKFIIKGGKRLHGEVVISGAKNAAVAIIPAVAMAESPCRIENVPNISDVKLSARILTEMGATVRWLGKNTVEIDPTTIHTNVVPSELGRKMRGSYYNIGALLGRCSKAIVPLPGGCDFGVRPIDQHIKGFEALGVKIEQGHGYIEASAPEGLKGTSIYFDFPSVGATENIMMAASLAEGTTILENAAEEPEIVDLANYLNKMGAKIRGAGTDTIRIEGVEKLHGADYTIIPDRIEAGTYMIAAAMTGGDIVVENVLPEHQKPLIAKLREAGAVVEEDIDKVRVIGKNPLKAVSIKTLPYPGFPTDMQAQMMAMMVIAEGRSKVTETVFENRFMHVVELNRMGAQISTEGRSAVIDGPCKLTGCDVRATDLRAGAAMILAGLVAEGTTRIGDLHHIDRGYENIVAKLKNLGADIERVDVD